MGTPKALLDIGEETFLARLRRVLATRCRDVITVGFPQAPFAFDALNPNPERGMLSSLQCGLERVAADVDAVLFTLVDLPAVQASTVEQLVDGWRGEAVRIPRYQGKRGHPVLFARALIAEFAGETATPKDVIARHEGSIVYMDTGDAGVTMDIDTPADYRRLLNQ